MDTRTIYYINEKEDYIENEVQLALTKSPDENFESFCETLVANYAMMNIDVINYSVKREIYYLEDE